MFLAGSGEILEAVGVIVETQMLFLPLQPGPLTLAGQETGLAHSGAVEKQLVMLQ